MLILLTVFHTLNIFYLSLADFTNFPGPQWPFSRAFQVFQDLYEPWISYFKIDCQLQNFTINKPLVLTCLTPPCYLPVAGNMDTISEAVWQGMNFTLTSNLACRKEGKLLHIFHFLSLWVLNVSVTHFCLHVSCN